MVKPAKDFAKQPVQAVSGATAGSNKAAAGDGDIGPPLGCRQLKKQSDRVDVAQASAASRAEKAERQKKNRSHVLTSPHQLRHLAFPNTFAEVRACNDESVINLK